ncbi:DprA-like DNA processing chain A [Ruegeria phage RpAliso]|nr:DprA-like DNA processing chain A [Ruegeria phage RpAliso]
MIALITGGRDYRNKSELFAVLDRLHAERNFSLIVHGDAGLYKLYARRPLALAGADALAGRWADERGIDQIKFPANWNGHGNAAGMRRNKQMLEMIPPDVCIAFPGGRGTANMMRIAREAGVELIDVEDL